MFKVSKNDRKVNSVTVTATAGIFEFQADFFIDATGDGELIALSECDYQLGRENDRCCQPMTTCFRVAGVDIKKFKEERPILQKIYAQKRAEGIIKNPRENILAFVGLGDGILHFNTTRIVKHDPTNPFELSEAEVLARRQIVEMLEFMKENAESCKNAFLVHIANGIGIRESRKLKGVYVITSQDILSCKDFEDTIALGDYGIDIHNPEGTGTTFIEMEKGNYYKIPYRCLLPKEYDNMLVAGRCLSADHVAHSAVRVMPICACIGEAAGTALAIAKSSGTNARTVNIDTVRATLMKNGARVN